MRNNPELLNIQQRHCENLKSCFVVDVVVDKV